MTGHVFVAPGTLEGLLVDDVLISTDRRARVGRHFWPVFGWSPDEGARWAGDVGHFPAGRRVLLTSGGGVPADGTQRWLVDVGADSMTPVSWLLEGVHEALRAVAQRPGGTVDRTPLRVAMPVMGVGRGGYDGKRGEVIDGLFREARYAANRYGIDVVIVAARPADYSALQAVRMRRHDLSLSEVQERQARRLASLARAGRLALFMGAGTGIGAGLPSWDDLLARVSERVRVEDPEAVAALGPLDAAELLRRAAREDAAFHGGGAGELGAHVAEVIGERSRYALSHVFLAALNADQAITTNFDRLYEAAVAAVRGPESLTVLPTPEPQHGVSGDDRRPWLLKLHGDVRDPSSIVLDRRSFVRYDAQRRPLGGVLQTTLLTRHLLVVGASMTDDNVVRLIHEVAELTSGQALRGSLGTILSLRPDVARTRLWDPEFEFVDLSCGSDDIRDAARNLEILLDRIALLAAPRWSHLLDPRYLELLETPQERDVAERLGELVTEINGLAATGGDGWEEVSRALAAFGLPAGTGPVARADVPTTRVPRRDADLGSVWRFALTYDGYRRQGGFEPLAELANASAEQYRRSGELPAQLPVARAALFFEQRRWRHFGADPGAEDLQYLQALVERIRDLSGGVVDADHADL